MKRGIHGHSWEGQSKEWTLIDRRKTWTIGTLIHYETRLTQGSPFHAVFLWERGITPAEPAKHAQIMIPKNSNIHCFTDRYTAAMDNHVARDMLHSAKFAISGDSIGDMVEISTIRREDLATHRGKVPGDQVHQAGNCASTACARGHQVIPCRLWNFLYNNN